jgi:hypothetical protein
MLLEFLLLGFPGTAFQLRASQASSFVRPEFAISIANWTPCRKEDLAHEVGHKKGVETVWGRSSISS